MRKILTVVGARPQFIKSAPVSFALQKIGLNEKLIHTGQHYDKMMSQTFFDELNIPPPFTNLGVGSKSHGAQLASMIHKLEEIFTHERPEAVLVYGDTNSTLAGALTACKLKIPLVHVESGLRSFNRTMPEEHNRTLTDHCSDLLICPTPRAVRNLENENIKNNVFLAGDTMKDAVRLFTPTAIKVSELLKKMGLDNQGFILATLHRPYNTDDKQQLSKILTSFASIKTPIILPVHPRLDAQLKLHSLEIPSNICTTGPIGYFDMLALIQSSQLIVTDSGGLQKEAYFLSKQCITLRPETEWIETIELGWNRLVWGNIEVLEDEILNARGSSPSEKKNLFGDGYAAEKIAKILKRFL